MLNRRSFLQAALGGAAAALAADRRPLNIVFFLTDDQRWDTLGCMGNPVIQTPHTDALARDGVLFRNNFCSTSICCVSRASIFTGLLERAHGISDFATPLSPDAFSRSYPALLRNAGYRTGFIGKYGVGNTLPSREFDYFAGFPGQGKYYPQKDGEKVHLTRIQQDQCLEFLNGCRPSQPFCLSVSFKAPHVQDEDPLQFLSDPAYAQRYADVRIPLARTATEHDFEALPSFLRNSEGRKRWQMQFSTPEMAQRSIKNYYRLITQVDDVVGRVRQELSDRGLLDNTLLIFTGDNGYFLGEHGLSHKWYQYEESIRTPLVIWHPRLARSLRGRKLDPMALNIDLAPTMLNAAGLTPPASMQGRDLLPLVEGKHVAWRPDWFYSHLFSHPLIPKSEGIRTSEYSYIRWIDQEPVVEELYNIRRDPGNVQNLVAAPEHRATLDRLRVRWRTWRTALAEWRPNTSWHDPQ